jgi:hypothetical protein
MKLRETILKWRVRNRGHRAGDSAHSSLPQEMLFTCDRSVMLKERCTDSRNAQQPELIEISNDVHQSLGVGVAAEFEVCGLISVMPVISNSFMERKDERLKVSSAEMPCGQHTSGQG